MNGVSGGFVRFLSLLLAFVLGFVSCVGTLVLGGLFIYRRVSYETLADWGVPLPSTQQILDPHADVRLTALTLEELLVEIQTLSALGDGLTLDVLVERYGLKLPEESLELLPPTLMSMPLGTLFSSEGIDTLLEQTKVEYLFRFLPGDVLSEPAREALEQRSLAEVLEFDLLGLMDEMKLGYFVDVTYEKTPGGQWVVVYEDPSAPSVMELLAPLSLGSVLEALTEGGDLLGVVERDVGTVQLAELLGEDGKERPISAIVKDKTLADVIVYDPVKGESKLDIEGVFEDCYIGDLQGHQPVYSTTDPTLIDSWTTEGGAALSAIEGAVASIRLRDFLSDSFDISHSVDHLYLGEVMEYERGAEDGVREDGEPKYIWYQVKNDGHGGTTLEELDALNAAIANLTLGDLLVDDSFDVAGAFEDLYIGEIMGYERGAALPPAIGDTYTKYEWLDGTSPIGAIPKKFANYRLGDIMDGSADISADDMYLHEVLGLYRKDYVAYRADGETLLGTYTVWYEDSACTVPAADVLSELATVRVGDLENRLPDIFIGGVVGLARYGAGWYEVSEPMQRLRDGALEDYVLYTPAEGVMVTFAGLSIEDMSDSTKVQTAIDDMKLSDAMGYTLGADGRYYDVDVTDTSLYTYNAVEQQYTTALGTVVEPLTGILAVIAPKRIGEVATGVDDIYVGEILGWTPVYEDPLDPASPITAWLDGTGPAQGMMTTFAGLTVAEMSDESAVHEAVKKLTLAEAMNYTTGEEDGRIYAVNVNDPALYEYRTVAGVGGYYRRADDTLVEPVHGVIATLAGAKVGTLESDIKAVFVGEVMGWTPIYVDPTDPSSEIDHWEKENGEIADGVAVPFAHLTLNELSSESEVEKVAKTVRFATVLGLTLGEADGFYYEVNVNDTSRYAFDAVEGKYKDLQTDLYVSHASGITSAFAALSVGEMRDTAKVQAAVGNVTLADVMGYELRPDGYYYSGGARVTGIMGTLADSKIDGLDARINHLTLEDIFTEAELSTGVLSLLDPTTRLYAEGSEPGLTEAVAEAIDTATIGRLMVGEPGSSNILEIDATTQNALNTVDLVHGNTPGYWKTLGVNELLSYIISAP